MSSSTKVQERSIARLSLYEKLTTTPTLLRALVTAFASCFTYFLHPKEKKPPTLYRYVMYAMVRAITDNQSPRQMHYISPSTDAAYEKVCKKRGVQPDSVILEDGTRAHWIGSSKAKNVLINFHGGGYVLPASEFMLDFMFRVQKLLQDDGKDIAILFLSYDLAPEAQYPRQLQQAASLLKHLTTTLKVSPSNILLSGDSAGGNLVLALLSHLSHPHPDTSIPRIKLSSKLRGAVLVSPWLDFNMDAHADKASMDLIGPVTGKRWSAAWLGTQWPHKSNTDNYNQATLAPASWWEDVQIEEALVVAGRDELLYDGILRFVERWQTQVPSLKGKVSWLAAAGEAHDMPSLDLQFGFKEPGEQARMIRSWLNARL